MRRIRPILSSVGLLLCSLGVWGASPSGSYVFYFAKGSTSVDLSVSDNEQCAEELQGEFAGDRFSRVAHISVVGVIDSEGNYGANLRAARDRAESVARFVEQKYSWVFVDGRLPIEVEVEQGAGTSRSVRVELRYRAVTPVVEEIPTLGSAPSVEATSKTVGEFGVLQLPPKRIRSVRAADFEPTFTTPEEFPLVALKTNMLFDLATAVNLEIELPIGRRWSVLVSGVFPAFNYDNHYCVRILETSLEGRYWFPRHKERLSGHFVGVYGHWIVDYDLQWDRQGLMGSGYGFGLTYGYAHPISRDFNLEYSLGVGAVCLRNKSYEVSSDYQYKQLREATEGWSVLPTRLKVSLVWRIGGEKTGRK